MGDRIKVSVIIPVYNVEKYLKKCLESVINQTERAIEIICIEDCSTDGSLEVLEEYADKDNRIIIVKNEKNRGQAYSRNQGINIARGKYIFFVDADDYISLDIISDLYNESIVNNLDMIFCNVEMVDSEYTPCSIQSRRRKNIYPISNGVSLCSQMTQNDEMFGAPWGILYRTAHIRNHQIRFREDVIHEDIPFVFNAIICSSRAGCNNMVGYYYVQRSNSTMHDNNIEKRLKGVIIAYFDMLTMWSTNRQIGEENAEGIKKFIDIYLYVIKGYFSQIKTLQQNHKNAMLAYLEEIKLFETAERIVDFSKEDWKTIHQSNYVAIYGGKENALKVLHTLNKRNVHVDCFVVSELKDNLSDIENIKVISWNEFNRKAEKTVIVRGVSKRYRYDVEDMVKSRGYRLIHPLDI